MREDISTNSDMCLACAAKPGTWEIHLKWSGGLVGNPPAPVADIMVGKICDECKDEGMTDARRSSDAERKGT